MGERFKGVALGYVFIVVQTLVGFIYTPLLLNGIGQSEFGLYQLVGSIAAYMTILESMLTSAALRFYCRAKAAGDSREMARTLGMGRYLYRCAAVLVSLFGVFAVMAFRQAYVDVLTPSELDEGALLLTLLIATIVLNMLNYTTTVILSGNEKFSFLKIVDTLAAILQPFVVIVVIAALPFAFVITLVQFVVTALSWLIKRNYVSRSLEVTIESRRYSLSEIRPMLAFSSTIAIAMVADIIFAKSNQLVLGWISGTGAVAVYSVGYQVFSSYSSLGTILSSVFMPRISEIALEEDASRRLTDSWIQTGRFTYFIITAIMLGFALYGMEFLTLWVGRGYEESYYVALLMMAGYYIDILQKLALTILQVLNKYGFRSFLYVLGAIANIPLSIILSMHFGVIGAAAASAVVLLATSGVLMNIYYGQAVGLDVKRFWLEIVRAAKCLPVAIVVGMLIGALKFGGIVTSFIVHCLLFAGIYVALAFISFNPSELAYLKAIVKRG